MYFEHIEMSNEQRECIQELIKDIQSLKTCGAEIYFPTALRHDENSKREHITLELYVEPCDFISMVDLSDKYLDKCVRFTVTKKENKGDVSGFSYAI